MERIGKSRVQSLSLAVVWKELQVLSRLLYRAKNQHRRDRTFQKLLRISKELKRYQAVGVSGYLKQQLKVSKRSPMISEVELSPLMTKLLDCAQFTARQLQLVEETFSEIHGRLQKSLFIPFNLLMCACLSRIWFGLRHHLWAVSQVYSEIRAVLPSHTQFSRSIAECLDKQHKHYLTKVGTIAISGRVEQASRNERINPGDLGVPVVLSDDQAKLRRQSSSAPAKRKRTRTKAKFVVVKLNVGKKVRRVKVTNKRIISKLLKNPHNVSIVASGGMKQRPKRKKRKKMDLQDATCSVSVDAPKFGSDVRSLQQTFEQDMLHAQHVAPSVSDIDNIFKVLERT